MGEEHLGEVSEAAVKVAGEAEDLEEERVEAAVVKAGAGEVTAAPLKARAKLKVLPAASKTTIVHLSLHHISTKKNCHPSGACSRPPPPPPLLSF